MNYEIIPYHKKYFKNCVHLLENTWSYKDRFHSSETSIAFQRIFFTNSLAYSNANSILLEDGKFSGFLIGKINFPNISFKSLFAETFHIFQIWYFYFLYTTKKNKKAFLSTVFLEDKIEKKVCSYGKKIKADGEVLLFIVDPNSKGKGFGKKLLNHFIDLAKKQNIKKFFLRTDIECNYHFYDHFGMKKECSFYNSSVSGEKNTANSFIYSMDIKNLEK